MRTSIVSVAFAAALVATTFSPAKAEAQVIVTPGVTVSPYGVYSFPNYSYGYQFANPYVVGSAYSWSSPFNYGSYSWATPNPYYYPTPYTTARPFGFGVWPNYVYRGWNGRTRW